MIFACTQNRYRIPLLHALYRTLASCAVLCSCTFWCSLAIAATYSLPANIGTSPFNNCSFSSGTTYNCTGSITLANNTTINVTAPMTLNLTTGSFTAGNNLIINNGGNAFTIYAAQSININNNFTGSVNLQAVQTINIGNNGAITGNLTAGSTLNIGNNSSVAGTCIPSNAKCTAVITGPDHYELSLPTSSINCLPTTLTVTACANTSSPCTSAYTTASGKTATLTTSGASLAATSVTFNSAGVATTTLSYPSAPNGTSVSVTLSGEQTTATNARQCCANGTACSAANNCSTTFNTAGFIISNSTGGSAATIPSQTAGTASSTYYLRAVQSSTTTKTCESALSGSTTVNWAYQCNNPTTCASGNLMSVTGNSPIAITGNPNSGVASYTPVPMSFDANGNAPFTFTFSDVGQATLWASKTVNSATLSGSSNAFVTKPGGFIVSAIKQTASPYLTNPAAASASDPKFVKAGESFTATVTATTSGGATTPNYGKETSPEGVLLTRALVLPSGGSSGTLSNSIIAGSNFSNGVATVANLSWSEVGIMTLTPSVADGDYLGAGSLTGATTGNIGRFYPDNFNISGASLTAACAASTPFSYFGQDGFTTAFTLTARNAANGTTQNYSGAFAKLDLSDYTNYDFSAAPLPAGAGLTSSSTAPSGNWLNGVASVSVKHQISRPTVLTGATPITISAAPTDGEVPAAGNTAVGSAANMRYGRLKLQNAYGSELLDLPVSLLAQYWNGTAWVQNTDDSCTSIVAPSSAAGLTFYPEVAANARGNHLSAAETTATVSITGKFAAGDGKLKLSKPGAGNSGYVDIAIVVPAWLKFPWKGAANADPTARATFGIYKSPLIYLREIY